MDAETRKLFEAHITELELRACNGDEDAAKSLACMALLVAGDDPPDGGGGEIIDFTAFLRAA